MRFKFLSFQILCFFKLHLMALGFKPNMQAVKRVCIAGKTELTMYKAEWKGARYNKKLTREKGLVLDQKTI